MTSEPSSEIPLVEALAQLTNLTDLYLDSYFDKESMTAFAEVLPNSRIQHLSLGRASDVTPLASVLTKSSVTSLTLFFRRPLEPSVNSIFALPDGLKSLTIYNSSTAAVDCDLVASALPSWPSLRSFSLDSCSIVLEQAELIAAVLSRTNIEELNLSGNKFGLKGCSAVVRGLIGSRIWSLNLNWDTLLSDSSERGEEQVRQFFSLVEEVARKDGSRLTLLSVYPLGPPDGFMSGSDGLVHIGST
jgi:hypothetical protein